VLVAPHAARSRPRSNSTRLTIVATRRPITGEQTVLPVLGHATSSNGHRWLRVRLPGRPNGLTGWIERAKTIRRATSWHLVVDLSKRKLVVYHHGVIVRVRLAVVGKPSTPTPRGTYFVEEDVQLSHGETGGPFALALSARSNVFQEFDGGPGQIALHGLQHVGGVPGTAASHGCVRLDTETMFWLVARIGPGVPVTIEG
jgi:lipoprotein-anchoring transpeptidase ErfK/SrfK